jgi:hypothetical protein
LVCRRSSTSQFYVCNLIWHLVFQIKNIEMWNKVPLYNDPPKYKVSYRDRPIVFNNGQMHILHSDLQVPLDKAKMNVNTPKLLENVQGKTSFWQKKTKVRNRQTKTLAKGSSLKTGTFKSCRLKPVLWALSPPLIPLSEIN